MCPGCSPTPSATCGSESSGRPSRARAWPPDWMDLGARPGIGLLRLSVAHRPCRYPHPVGETVAQGLTRHPGEDGPMAEDEALAALLGRLSVAQKAALCLGADFWHTAPVPAAGIESIMVSDGPHGLRKQADQADPAAGSGPATCFP